MFRQNTVALKHAAPHTVPLRSTYATLSLGAQKPHSTDRNLLPPLTVEGRVLPIETARRQCRAHNTALGYAGSFA